MLPELARTEIAYAVDGVVAELLGMAAVREPAVDSFAVADALGVAVVVDSRLAARARYVRLAAAGRGRGRPTIVLRPEPRVERRQWAVAHEIGEHVAPQLFSRLGVEPREAPADAREQLANTLAARLLVPSEWYRSACSECDSDLVELKSRFSTASHELLARRWVDEAVGDVVVTIADHGNVCQRMANWEGTVPRATGDELVCLAAVHRSGQMCETMCRVGRVRAWPVHEPDWRREIARTDVDAFVG